MLCHVLAEQGERVWLVFRRPAAEENGARFVSHYVVCTGDEAVLIDPGGPADFGPLLAAVSDKIDIQKITTIIASRGASQIAGSLGMWAEVLGHETPIYAADVLLPDLLHIDPDLNIQGVGENGAEVSMIDGAGLHILPAPYLPTASSVSVYDPTARVLYTGDIGTVEGPWADDTTPFSARFSLVGHAMNAFHQSWFASGPARDDWLARIEGLSVDIIAPRAGPCFQGKDVLHFIRWLATMDVGVLVENREPSFLATEHYAPDRLQADEDVFETPDVDKPDNVDDIGPSAAPEHEDDEEYVFEFEDDDSDDAYTPLSAEDIIAGYAEDGDDDEVSKLVDALDDHETPLIGADGDTQDEDDDDEDAFDIVYIDEDGNEIDPSEVDEDDIFEEEEMLEGNDEQRLEFPPGQMFRLITRSDFDGLVCAVLLEELDLINDILFVHPNQMQEGEIEVSMTDISTNLPYTPGIFAAFDHHLSEIKRLGKHYDNHIIDPRAPSAARVVYSYFGGEKRFPDISVEMMDAVDKGDSAQFVIDEVINAEGWPLLNFIMDSRTGLGRYRGFRVPNYELMMSLIDYCRRYSIEEILEHPDVKERVELYREHEAPAREQIKRCTQVYGNLAVVDYRHEDTIYVTNRFMVYAMFPDCNISMHVLWGRAQQNTVFAVGKSIFNRTSETNIGELMLTYGGGGHRNAGTCQADNALSDVVKDALIQRINADG
tara:strand:+ start:20171 stop:22315 length:2145 start_codon:yes stop_codon:yes gene_type:complete